MQIIEYKRPIRSGGEFRSISFLSIILIDTSFRKVMSPAFKNINVNIFRIMFVKRLGDPWKMKFLRWTYHTSYLF